MSKHKNAEQHAERRRSIVCAAILMLREVGVRKFAMKALAKRMGVSKPAVYYYFEGGEIELLTECYRELLRAEASILRVFRSSGATNSEPIETFSTVSDIALIRNIETLIGHHNFPESFELWQAFDDLSIYSKRDYMLQLMPVCR